MAFISLADLSKSRWGTNSRLIDRVVAVSTTATTILPENPRRVAYLIINRSSSAGSVGFSRPHSYTTGVYLPAEGGVFGLDFETDGEAVGYRVYGVLAAGSGDFYTLEVILK